MRIAEGRSARARILEAADALFYAEGIRAVGVDTICRESEVTKMTLYRHFSSKDELITAYAEERILKYWTWFDGVMERHPDDARQQLRDLVVAQADRLEDPHYRGCPFININTEICDPAHPARNVVQRHKEELHARLTALGRAAGARDPGKLADQLLLLLHGSAMSARIYISFEVRQPLTEAAAILFEAHIENWNLLALGTRGAPPAATRHDENSAKRSGVSATTEE